MLSRENFEIEIFLIFNYYNLVEIIRVFVVKFVDGIQPKHATSDLA